MSKLCNVCKEELDLTYFHRRKTSKDGYRNTCKACVKEWQADKKEIYKEKKRIYRENHREENRKTSRDWYQTNRENVLERNKKWRQSNRDKIRQYDSSRRAKLNCLVNTMPRGWWKILLNFYGNSCQNPSCDYEITEINRLTHDHVIPISWEGSTHSLKNSQILCLRCNSSKQAKSCVDYRDWSKGILLDDLTVIYDKINA